MPEQPGRLDPTEQLRVRATEREALLDRIRAALTADPGGTKKPKVFKLPTTKLKNATQQ